MTMKPILFLFIAALPLSAQPAPEKKKEEAPSSAAVESAPVVRQSTVNIDGKTVPYKATTGKIQLKKDDGTPRASIFHVTYERTDTKDAPQRPVVFCFNGGPGSSSVWLHLGAIGPRRVELPGDGTTAPTPPARVIDNAYSILDVADLVFIDPVSTGYSRAEKDTKPNEFHGVEEDIASVGDFIRRWTTDHNRWASPKFLLGESYGGIRAAGLAEHLQSRYGMSLNGIVMLSTLIDFRTVQGSTGDGLSNSVFLPVLTGTAFHHGKIKGDRAKLIEESRRYAFGEYASALLKGAALDAETTKATAAKLAELTGIPADLWVKHKLRLDPFEFRVELLRAEGKALGRFDARVAWDTADGTAAYADWDPSYALAYGTFSTAMLDYLGRDLGWKEDQPYEILTPKVQPWNWGKDNTVLNMSRKLTEAMIENPALKVLVMGGLTDLATPPDGMAYSIRQMLYLPEKQRGNFKFTFYDGGHMFYMNPPDLVKGRVDMVEFIQGASR